MLNRGELVDRIDADFYKSDYQSFRRYLKKSSAIKIKQLILSFNRGDGPRDGFYTDDESGVNFLRINNLKENSIDLTDVKLINRHVHEKTLRRTQVTTGDVIFAVSGTKENLGTVSIIPEHITEANLNSALLKLNLDTTRIDKEFFAIFFDTDIAIKQIYMIGKGAAQNNLNSQEVFSIYIPQPSLERQKEIVEWYKIQKAEKKAKEAEAREKLASVDNLVLDALGITLPDAEENTLAKRIFFTKSSDIASGRFDSPFYRPYFKKFNQAILKSLCKPLRNITNFASEVWDQKDFFDLTFPYIEISGIKTQTGEIFEVSEIEKAEAPSRARLIVRKDDILVSTTRPNRGAITLLKPKHDFHIASTGFAVIREVLEVSKEYLLLLLRHQICLTQMEQRSSGGNYPAITLDELQNIQIPIPPPEVQAEIAERVEAIYAEAKLLREEGAAILKHAKEEVERMILGDD